MQNPCALRPPRASVGDLDTVFAQRGNLLSPTFLRMVRDVVRFGSEAPKVRDGGGEERGAKSEEPRGPALLVSRAREYAMRRRLDLCVPSILSSELASRGKQAALE